MAINIKRVSGGTEGMRSAEPMTTGLFCVLPYSRAMTVQVRVKRGNLISEPFVKQYFVRAYVAR